MRAAVVLLDHAPHHREANALAGDKGQVLQYHGEKGQVLQYNTGPSSVAGLQDLTLNPH